MDQKKAAGEGRSTPDRKKSASRPKSATSTKSASTARQSKTPKARTRASQRPQIARRTSTAQRLRQWGATFYGALKNPETWRTARQKLPPWTDEVGAILLIVLGAVMLTALLNTTSEARASVMLSDGLRQLFGSMAYVAALGVLAAGIIILLPKFGIVVRIGWTRAIAIELAFGAACALLHLAADDPQPRILAWEGGGGGFVGWGLTEITSVLGRFPSIALHALVLGATAVYYFRLAGAPSHRRRELDGWRAAPGTRARRGARDRAAAPGASPPGRIRWIAPGVRTRFAGP